MGEEGFAVAGVAEHEDESGLVGGQPLDDLVEGGAGHGACHGAGCGAGGALDQSDALGHIQLGWVVRVGAQPARLPRDVAA